MRIAFFTEMLFQGKIPRNHDNMRTEFAWISALNADHYNIQSIPEEKYDLGIVIIPKKNPNFNIDNLRVSCDKIAVMQEGPNWFWQDYDLSKQVWYYNTLTSNLHSLKSIHLMGHLLLIDTVSLVIHCVI